MTTIIDMDGFRSGFGGDVLTETDADYDTARSLFNGSFDRYPAVIARCESTADVVTALRFAREFDLEVSVRGGAHSFTGASVVEGGVMIDLSRMRGVVVDAAAQRAVCGGGATLADLDAATQEHGLAVTGGLISHTGVGGLTLGGGMGWLSRRFGLSVDNLLSAEVVLADGRCVRASADEHPDLFWALRGGGGNFGVVTAFEFRVQPLGPEVHLGLFFWGLDQSVEALRLSRDVVTDLPAGSGAMIAAGLTAPPAPFVPERHQGVPGCALLLAGFDGADEHDEVLREVRQQLPPLFEHVADLPYVQLQSMLDDSAPWGVHAYSKALYLDGLPDEAISVVAEHLPRKSSPMSFVPIFPLGGAYADVHDGATSFGGSRTARFAMSCDAVAPSAELMALDRAWARGLWDAVLPYTSGPGGYVNFIADVDEDRVRASYGPAKYERLARAKATYDPDNVFHLNANIKPAPPEPTPPEPTPS